MQKLRIVVGGFIGLYPTGGATWDYIQYVVGLKMLGHDVFYIEDTNEYPLYQTGKAWNDASDCIAYLSNAMKKFDLNDRWSYCDIASGKTFGLSKKKINDITATADLMINISCSMHMKDRYRKIPKRILIDSDPMFTQIQSENELANNPEKKFSTTAEMIESHNYLFTFGENINAADCRIPNLNKHWMTTRQPVCLPLWKNVADTTQKIYTSILNWSGRKKLNYNGEAWGQKDVEFKKLKMLPQKCRDSRFDMVINKPLNSDSEFIDDEMKKNGWNILSPQETVPDTDKYRQFIQHSYAEFSIAKETYVKARTGWFSCRSACYLAAGRPVVAQETGWSKYVNTAAGLHSFTTVEDAANAINLINEDYKKSRNSAQEIANEYFDSNKVLNKLLDDVS